MSTTEDLIKKHESCRLKPYLDTANPPKITIGWGRNLTDKGISQKEADLMFTNDFEDTIQGLMIIFPDWMDFSENRRAVLLDMLYNLGHSKFMKFTKMIEAIRNRNWSVAADEMLNSYWHQQVHGRAEEDAQLLRKG